jgi:hypothetical protein
VISDLNYENRFLVKKGMGVYRTDLVLKLDFMAHVINGVPLRVWTLISSKKKLVFGLFFYVSNQVSILFEYGLRE